MLNNNTDLQQLKELAVNLHNANQLTPYALQCLSEYCNGGPIVDIDSVDIDLAELEEPESVWVELS